MCWVGLIGIATIALLRCVVLFAPQVEFEIDPALPQSAPLAGLGPAGSMLLDVLLLLSCAAAVFGEWRSARGNDWILFLLALIPLPLTLYHGWNDAGHLWRGSTWVAAVVACATVAHLARNGSMRCIFISVLVAIVVPLLARGAAQMTYEHADTVRFYEQHREEILASKGWQGDSPVARIYERRLRQPEPLGWFATTNIFASVMGFGAILCAGLMVSAVRAKLQSGWAGAMLLLTCLAGAGLFLTHSKGALLAALLGLGAFAIYEWGCSAPLFRIGRTRPRLVVIGLILCALLAVVVRGVMLPENFAGDKSLLYRWHYLAASARMFIDHVWIGVGPDGFQQAYTLYRLPRNPEEVASAHSMFADWLCNFGVSGGAWVALLTLIAWRSTIDNSIAHHFNLHWRSAIATLLAVLALVTISAIVIEWQVLDERGFIVRALGMTGFLLVAGLCAHVVSFGWSTTAQAALVAAVAMLLVHGQIEMTFSQPGSAVWALCAVGLMASPRAGASKFGLAAGAVVAIVLVSAATLVMWIGVIPAYAQQRAVIAAADALRPIAQHPDDVDLMLRLRGEVAPAKLVEAYERWPADVRPLELAAIQLQTAAWHPQQPESAALLRRARAIINRALADHHRSFSMVLAVQINSQLAQLTRGEEYWNDAIHYAQQLSQRDPNSIGAWRRLGDVLWMRGNRRDAASAYERALECDHNFELDEFKRLPERDRKEMMERIAEASVIGAVER